MTPTAVRIYTSRVDAWLMAVFIGSYLFGVGAAVVVMLEGGLVNVLLGVLLLVLLLLPLGLMVPLRYIITPHGLAIRAGILRWHIPLKTIHEVRPSRNMLSSPALSLDRLEVRYGTSSILISPADRSAFLHDLTMADPSLRRLGDRLVRES